MHLQSIPVSSGTDPLKESLVPVTHCYYHPEMELISILVPRHSLRDQPPIPQGQAGRIPVPVWRLSVTSRTPVKERGGQGAERTNHAAQKPRLSVSPNPSASQQREGSRKYQKNNPVKWWLPWIFTEPQECDRRIGKWISQDWQRKNNGQHLDPLIDETTEKMLHGEEPNRPSCHFKESVPSVFQRAEAKSLSKNIINSYLSLFIGVNSIKWDGRIESSAK